MIDANDLYVISKIQIRAQNSLLLSSFLHPKLMNQLITSFIYFILSHLILPVKHIGLFYHEPGGLDFSIYWQCTDTMLQVRTSS